MQGVAILYRWSVASDQERQFVRQWRTAARELRRLGALGCSLLRADNGEFVGLIRWPSEYARSQAGKAPQVGGWPGIRGFAEARLSVEDDVTSGVPAPLGLAL